MAFTGLQKVKIRWYLGYGVTYQQYNTYLEGAILQAEADPDVSGLVIAQLAVIENVNTLISTDSLENAGLKGVEEIEFYPNGEQLIFQNAEGKKEIGRLSILLGVVPFSDWFGKKGYSGISHAYNPYGYIQLG